MEPIFFSFLVVILISVIFIFGFFLRCFPIVNVEPLYVHSMTKTIAHYATVCRTVGLVSTVNCGNEPVTRVFIAGCTLIYI